MSITPKKTYVPNDYFEQIGAWPANHAGSDHLRKMYVIGFVASLVLTLGAYVLVVMHAFSSQLLLIIIVVGALVQFFVQLFCFLHLGKGAASRDKFMVLGFAAVIVFILVSGSIWIMTSLNNRMMPSTQEMELYMQHQTGI